MPPSSAVRAAPKKADPERELTQLRKAWPDLVTACVKRNPMLRTDLLDTWPKAVTEGACVIGFDPEFAGEMGEVKRAGREVLHHAVVEQLQRPVRLEFAELADPVTWSHHLKNPEAGRGLPSGNLRVWEENPAIRQILEVFHGDVRDVQK